MRLLNFGCGNRINEKWENIDFSPIDKRVKKVNLLKKLPYQESSFDVAYSSHFLEHLSVSQAQNVLMEIKRILKIGGILRIVVPDLQILCRDYLDVLQELKSAKITPQNLILDSKSLRGGGFRARFSGF